MTGRGDWRAATTDAGRQSCEEAGRHPGQTKEDRTIGPKKQDHEGGSAMLKRLFALGSILGLGLGLTLAPPAAQAQEVTLRLHQLLPLQATIPDKFLTPWIEKVEKEASFEIRVGSGCRAGA
jgi:hypothetical protein